MAIPIELSWRETCPDKPYIYDVDISLFSPQDREIQELPPKPTREANLQIQNQLRLLTINTLWPGKLCHQCLILATVMFLGFLLTTFSGCFFFTCLA